MNDCFGREIKAGDIIAFAARASSSTYLNVGQVIGPAKKDPGKLRVEVFQSERYGFKHGKTNWRTGEVIRQPGQPYKTTLACGERIIIVDAAPPARSYRQP